MKVDRQNQKEILELLKENAFIKVKTRDLPHADNPELIQNLLYLKEHGLIALSTMDVMREKLPLVHDATITAKGIDFLEDDGGLSAILGMVTVRFEAETLRAILSMQVELSVQDEGLKKRLLTNIRHLKSEALKSAVQELAAMAIRSVPDAIQLLGKYC